MKDYREVVWSYFDKLSEEDFSKVKCRLEHGQRIHWYFKDDEFYAKDFGLDVKDLDSFSGLVLALEDVESFKELDIEDALIVMDRYPTEKEACRITYFTLAQLLTNKDLVEIY